MIFQFYYPFLESWLLWNRLDCTYQKRFLVCFSWGIILFQHTPGRLHVGGVEVKYWNQCKIESIYLLSQKVSALFRRGTFFEGEIEREFAHSRIASAMHAAFQVSELLLFVA